MIWACFERRLCSIIIVYFRSQLGTDHKMICTMRLRCESEKFGSQEEKLPPPLKHSTSSGDKQIVYHYCNIFVWEVSNCYIFSSLHDEFQYSIYSPYFISWHRKMLMTNEKWHVAQRCFRTITNKWIAHEKRLVFKTSV